MFDTLHKREEQKIKAQLLYFIYGRLGLREVICLKCDILE